MTATCARPGCSKPIEPKATGRPVRFCSAACRVAASRERAGRPAADTPLGSQRTMPASDTRPGPSTAGGGVTKLRRQLCPVDPTHGPVLDWPTARWGFHCPHVDHDGRPATSPFGELAPSRAFFTTAEVQHGALDALRAEVDTTVAMRPGARPSRGARPDAGSTLDPPVVATFPPNDVAVMPPATHRAPERVPGPDGPLSSRTQPAAGDSGASTQLAIPFGG